jgi:hypothetical protein
MAKSGWEEKSERAFGGENLNCFSQVVAIGLKPSLIAWIESFRNRLAISDRDRELICWEREVVLVHARVVQYSGTSLNHIQGGIP